MPAASANKRARQRANKLSQEESAPSTPPAGTTKIASPPTQSTISTSVFSAAPKTATPAPWPAPAPATFTISYVPLSISYPEPPNPAAKLPTDAVRVTRAELALLLRQSYIHGSEHGWKNNVALAKEHLQVEFEKDMRDATVKFAIHEKHIRHEEFERGFKDGQAVGRLEHQQSIQPIYADCTTQTEPEQCTHIPHILYPPMPYKSSESPPAPLDWHSDPRLFELSHALKSLGWVPPLAPRPWGRFS